MAWYLFNIFFFALLILYHTRELAVEASLQSESVSLFEPKEMDMYGDYCDFYLDKCIKYFYSSFCALVDDLMIVFAEADYTDVDNTKVDIIAKYIETKGENWVENVMEHNGKNWKTQFVIQSTNEWNYPYAFKKPLAVAKERNIYLLAINYNLSMSKDLTGVFKNWRFVLYVGKVASHNNEGKGKTIEWEKHEKPLYTLTEQFWNQSLSVLPYGAGGFAFPTEDGSIVFVVNAKRENSYVSALIHFKDPEKASRLDLVYYGTAEYCYTSNFFMWKRKLIMVPSYCRKGNAKKLKESTNMGMSWTDATGPIYRLSDHLKDKSGFTVVTIENRTILLFVQVIEKQTDTTNAYDVRLWFLDNWRVHDVGSIFTHDKYVAFRGFLYTNDELFSLHQRWNKWPENIFLLQLKNKLNSIKSVLRRWNKLDRDFLQPCKTVDKQDIFLDVSSPSMPTEGLVGLLAGNTTESVWLDEYLYINAAVKGGRQVNNGFEFSIADSGAQWSVVQRMENQRYNFKKYGLTVLATLKIHEIPQGSSNSLLTVGLTNGYERLGLWYGDDKYWKVMSRSGGMAVLGGFWETNITYSIALVLINASVLVYVDGQHVGSLFYSSANESVPDIEHIFIGGYGDEALMNKISHVTVTNVLLYNRPLDSSEIQAIRRRLICSVSNDALNINKSQERFVACAGVCVTTVSAGFTNSWG